MFVVVVGKTLVKFLLECGSMCFLENLLTDGEMLYVLTMKHGFVLTHLLTPSSEFSLLLQSMCCSAICHMMVSVSWAIYIVFGIHYIKGTLIAGKDPNNFMF